MSLLTNCWQVTEFESLKHDMNRKLILVVVLGIASFAMIGVAMLQFSNWFRFERDVPEITTQELRTLQKSHAYAESRALSNGLEKPQADFVLVDVRTKAEYEVSMIPGAITAPEFEASREKYQGRTVICYCTVGYRSGIYARKLIENGVAAKNYKGSILEWCKAQYLLETLEGQPTNRVHTYNSSYHVPPEYVAIW